MFANKKLKVSLINLKQQMGSCQTTQFIYIGNSRAGYP